MDGKKENLILTKSYAFALEIIQVYKILSEQKEFVLSKQLLRSGTSVGANVHEAVSSESKKDFVHKLTIALKEARETAYWLQLLKDSSFISQQTFDSLHATCVSITKILNSIILTTKERYFKSYGL